MTRKHYAAIARVIALSVDNCTEMRDRTAILSIVHGLADTFRAENPRFDRDKFLTACGFTR